MTTRCTVCCIVFLSLARRSSAEERVASEALSGLRVVWIYIVLCSGFIVVWWIYVLCSGFVGLCMGFYSGRLLDV